MVETSVRQSRLDDLHLADRCMSGDEAAQREFFRRELPHVHATLYRILGSNVDMDDLLQEAFFQIFNSLGSYRGESSLSTWLHSVTVRVARAHLSRRKLPTVRLELVPEPAGANASAEERAHMREVARHLYAVLDKIEPSKRIAFALHVIDGRPLKEVAALMHSSVVLAKVRVWRARKLVSERARADPVLVTFFETEAQERK
jgi:RNA polymerase sigma-70 factor (ECF subfamily)